MEQAAILISMFPAQGNKYQTNVFNVRKRHNSVTVTSEWVTETTVSHLHQEPSLWRQPPITESQELQPVDAAQ